MSVASPNPAAVEEAEPVTQGSQMQRKNWPIWMQQFPYGSIKKPDDTFQLIDPVTLQTVLANENPEAVKRIQDDIVFLDYELLRLFRERDYEAKANQNRYRLYQIGYMLLAALATLFGSLLALSIQNSPEIVPVFSFLEFTTALGTTYLSTISGRDAPLQKWLTNRHKAEALRREYFRYLLNLAPYDGLDTIKRRRTLSQRAASFNLTGTIEPG